MCGHYFRESIVLGIKDNAPQELLSCERQHSLANAIDMCKANEKGILHFCIAFTHCTTKHALKRGHCLAWDKT